MILFLNKDDLFRLYIKNDICLNTCFNEKNDYCIFKKESHLIEQDNDDSFYQNEHKHNNNNKNYNIVSIEYKQKCGIYFKTDLIFSNKDGEQKNKSNEEWFDFIYFDYLDFEIAIY